MIVRISKRENPFVQIDKRPLEDSRISWRAKGILAYLISKPNNWEVRSEDIILHGSEGRDAVRAAMAELRSFGYAKLEQTRNGKQWIVFEEPCPENPSMGPSPEKPTPEKAKIGKSPPSNNKGERDNENALSLNGTSGRKRFTPPSLPEIEVRCGEIGLDKREAQKFFDWHSSRGWKVGRMPMVCWKAALNTWKSHHEERNGSNGKNGHTPIDPAGWKEWLDAHPEYHEICRGLKFSGCREFIQREFIADKKKVKA